MTVDLPARLLTDRLSWALAVASAVALEAMLARHPGLPLGPGLAIGGLVLIWQWRQRRRRPIRLSIGPSGVGVRLSGASASLRATGPRARVLGRSVVLHWRDPGGAGTLWLTPLDVPRDALRAVRVCINTARTAVAG